MPQPQRNRRGDGGLTTLEWLLVVAAVAGLAAVAVVLVQNVVGDTAEQIESHSARQEAAELAALELRHESSQPQPSPTSKPPMTSLSAREHHRLRTRPAAGPPRRRRPLRRGPRRLARQRDPALDL